eukprot:6206204-Pleurochrysis_carterae.AAC.2
MLMLNIAYAVHCIFRALVLCMRIITVTSMLDAMAGMASVSGTIPRQRHGAMAAVKAAAVLAAVQHGCTAAKHSNEAEHRRPPPTTFVQAQDLSLYEGERVFRYLGANVYWLMAEASYDEKGRQNVQHALDAAVDLGVTVVRTWGFADGPNEPHLQSAPGQFDPKMFDALDFVVAEAKARGLRLLLPLVNYWTDYGGIQQYLRWARKSRNQYWAPDNSCPAFFTLEESRQQYKAMVAAVTSHVNKRTGLALRDEPAIMGWELCNECRCRDNKGQMQARSHCDGR